MSASYRLNIVYISNSEIRKEERRLVELLVVHTRTITELKTTFLNSISVQNEHRSSFPLFALFIYVGLFNIHTVRSR